MTIKVENKTSFPFLGILCLIFITLKLCNVIAWSWFWVLSPILIPLIIVLGIGVFGLSCLLLAKVPSKKR